MIDPKELRIGNWISQMNFSMENETETMEFFQVEKIVPDRNVFSHYDPIPLTEQWLVKFGFKAFSPSIYRWYIDKNYYFEVEFYIESCYNPPKEVVKVSYYNYGSPIIVKTNIAVHLIQNLVYILTDQELHAH